MMEGGEEGEERVMTFRPQLNLSLQEHGAAESRNKSC